MYRFHLFVCVLTAALAGCADSGKHKVSGTVTLDGEPLPSGEIRFVDTSNQEFSDGGLIQDGKFSFEAAAGSRRVEIRASRESTTRMVDSAMEPDKKTPAMEEYIPAKYNANSTLTAEVTSGGPNFYELKLESK